jgi:hypothetical protein
MLDTFFMKLTGKRWKKMYQNQYEKTDFDLAFKTKSYTSKNHPNHFQKKITNLYRERLTAFGKASGIILHD